MQRRKFLQFLGWSAFMANFTPNYNLRKPEDADDVQVDLDLGANLDTIDATMKTTADAVAAVTETLVVYQDNDQIEVATNLVDCDLNIAVDIGVYAFEAFLVVVNGAAGASSGWNYGINGPASSDIYYGGIAGSTDNANAFNTAIMTGLGVGASTRVQQLVMGTVITTAAGTLKARFGYGGAGKYAPTLKKGSWFRATKIA